VREPDKENIESEVPVYSSDFNAPISGSLNSFGARSLHPDLFSSKGS
jgi:hypothetical protein